jgi:hypothetical protein
MKRNALRTIIIPNLTGLTCALLLSACAQSPKTAPALTEVPVTVPTPERQYMCVSKIYLSDITKAFIFPADDSGEGNVIAVGDLLDKRVKETFWIDTSPKADKRVAPNITLGFDRGTGVYRNPEGDGNLVQLRLQYQIFKPTGQSFSSTSFGQYTAKTSDQAATIKALHNAMEQALDRLADGLIQTGICKTAM